MTTRSSLVAALLLACVISGCTRTPHPAETITTPGPAVVSTSPTDAGPPPVVSSPQPTLAGSATSAALRAGAILFAANTAIDASFNATWLRHRDLLTPTYVQQLDGLLVPGGSDAGWQLWAAHKAVLTVTAKLINDDQPSDTPSSALRHLQLTLVPRGTAGWRGPVVQMGVVLILNRIDGRWLVGGVHVDV